MFLTKTSFISTICGGGNAVVDAGGELSSAERACVVLDVVLGVGGDDGDERSEFWSSGERACGVLRVCDDERDERSEFRLDASALDEDEL